MKSRRYSQGLQDVTTEHNRSRCRLTIPDPGLGTDFALLEGTQFIVKILPT